MRKSRHMWLLAAATAAALWSGATAADGGPSSLVAMAESELPADVRLVVWSIVLRMYGDTTANEGVAFAPGAGLNIAVPGSGLDGFVPARIAIVDDRPSPAGGRALDGTLSFQDLLGRRMAVAFSADYRQRDGGLVLDRAEVLPLFPDAPEPQVFLVPARAAPAGIAVGPRFADAFAFILDNAVSRTSEAGAVDYIVALVFPDRLPGSARFELRLAGARQAALHDFDGWRIYEMPVTLDGGAASLEVAYGGRLVGLYPLAGATEPAPADPLAALETLQALFDRRLITEEEYRAKRQSILDRL